MKAQASPQKISKKRDDILEAAMALFLKYGYENTTVRQIVQEANSSMGNLYFHFPNKLAILEVICENFINILRKQIHKVKDLSYPPEIGFALDLRLGYIATMEDPKLSHLWLVVRNIPEIHQYSLENKRIRLRAFFGDRISPDELDFLAVAIQGIADGFFQQKQSGNIDNNSSQFSNAIIDYSLRLIGYTHQEIENAISEVEKYIANKHITVDKYYKFKV